MTSLSSALFATIVFVALATPSRPATAIEYPWCAQYSGDESDGGCNCGFVSREQCVETVRGMGGFCERNLFYTGPDERPAKPARKRRND
ncbi:MAG TPA: DUF3551 domain-containing protein [Pseudolabrys sp.]|nr:DUF3551 domain-containing protein [Pseudolabrys sp.]